MESRYQGPCFTDGTSGAECGRLAVPTTRKRREVKCQECRLMLAEASEAELLAACRAGLREWSLHEKADENAARLCELMRAAIAKDEAA